MSLIDCPHCGRFISDNKGVCPICREILYAPKETKAVEAEEQSKYVYQEQNIRDRIERPWNTAGQPERAVCDATYLRLHRRGRK